jgi:uncharacterized membrane protein (DUF2068 family)
MTPFYPMFLKAVGKLLVVMAIACTIEVIALHFGFDRTARWIIWLVALVCAAIFIPAVHDLYSHEPFGPRENPPDNGKESK